VVCTHVACAGHINISGFIFNNLLAERVPPRGEVFWTSTQNFGPERSGSDSSANCGVVVIS
jgi:hypothetical protein